MSVITLTGYRPSKRSDSTPWTYGRMEGSETTSQGPWAEIETFNFVTPDPDPANPATRNFTSEDGTGDEVWVRIVFGDATADEEATTAILLNVGGFADARDVSIRLGRELTDNEIALAEGVIGEVTGLIVDAAGRDAAWAAALTPIPATLKALCVTKAVQAISNPANVASQSERLGAYQRSQTFPRSTDGGVFLTDAEERRCRRAVWGSNAASTRPESTATEIHDLRYGTGTDEDLVEE